MNDAAVILITGCSTGFGRELALAALSSGLRVIATARRPETLTLLEEAGAKALKLDVTASTDALKTFAQEVVSIFGRVDYLINNAGFLQGGAVEENTAQENLAQFNTNFFGVINVTNAFLPHFRERRQGTIVNISSQGAFLCIPGGGIYCASKAALDAISDTWVHELAGFNIRSISIQLGAFRTSVAESGNLKVAASKIRGAQSKSGAGRCFADFAGNAAHICALFSSHSIPQTHLAQMPRKTYHSQVTRTYLTHMVMRDLITPPESLDFATLIDKLSVDIQTLRGIRETRYLRERGTVAKAGNIHLAWVYAGNPNDHDRFTNMLRVSPFVFNVILELIRNHEVFRNNSNVPQTPVDQQLAVALYRLGRYGNAASLEDIARVAGCSEGSVENFTDRVFTAIESHHDTFVRPLTAEEKEAEKVWMDEHLGFEGLWRDGWIMYDGTIVVLYAKPGMNGQGYYTRKSNYGLNVQIGNVPSTLRIADYSLGHTGSAHDSAAFEGTAAYKHPDWLFRGNEFAWGDSAYTLSSHVIPVFKAPASFVPENAIFNVAVSRVRVRSEHCMGALKGRFQSLRGLRVAINSNEDHYEALRWVTVAIILHNLIIDVEGAVSGAAFAHVHTPREEEQDRGGRDEPHGEDRDDGDAKRRRLIDELLAYRAQREN